MEKDVLEPTFLETERWKKAQKIGWYIKPFFSSDLSIYTVRPPNHFHCKHWAANFITIKLEDNKKLVIPNWYYNDWILENGDWSDKNDF